MKKAAHAAFFACRTNNMNIPDRLNLAQTPTPFHCLERLSDLLGGPRIWVKRDDLTECAVSGNKIRKLEFVLARAMEQGCDTLITSGGLQSNHCRATALLGARLGLKVHLLLRDEGEYSPQPQGNLLLDYLAGAEVTIVPRSRFIKEADSLIAELADNYSRQGRSAWVIPVGASDGHGVWGYVNCARELKEDFERCHINPQLLFHATGSGGTQAGLSAGATIYDLPCSVVGMAVCDDAAYFTRKVTADLQHWIQLYEPGISLTEIPLSVNDSYIGPGYAVAGQEVFDTIRTVASLEGILLDPVYTGKAFHGMLEEIRAGHLAPSQDIVFVHTGGLFGLLAQGDQLGLQRSPQL